MCCRSVWPTSLFWWHVHNMQLRAQATDNGCLLGVSCVDVSCSISSQWHFSMTLHDLILTHVSCLQPEMLLMIELRGCCLIAVALCMSLETLHSHDIPDWVIFKLGMMIFGCGHGQVPASVWHYITSWQHLWSASHRLVVVPRTSWVRDTMCQYMHDIMHMPSYMAAAGPLVWNLLPDSLHNLDIGRDSLNANLICICFQYTKASSTLEVLQWYTL